IFMLTGLLGAIAFFAAIFKLPGEKSENRGKSPDMSGNILYVIFIVMMMYGLSEIGKGMIYVLITAVGVILGILFIIHESRSEDPIVNVTLFRENKGYAFSNISAMLNYGATFAISYLISIYLQVVMGYSSQTAGLIMIFQPIIMAVLSPVMGRFSDRISPFKMSSVGMAFCAAGTFIFIFIGRETQIFVIIMALVITGLGFSLFSSPNTNAVMSCVDKAEYGVASSILATMRSIGHTLSMVIVTITVTMLIEDMPLADAPAEVLIKVIRISFIVFTLICTAGVFISLKRK
ncbi:MAG: MFS transporter, partial [Lentihominibacter sp.]